MEVLPIIFAVILTILTVVLTIVGVQMVLVLSEIKKTLRKVNATLDTIEHTALSVTQPLHNLGGMATGLTTGFKVFESFVSWIQKNKEANAR
ncbi:MAG: hypothetical protein M3Q81_02380 [bacterium]|nr:hypothetical protein [bacterium]